MPPHPVFAKLQKRTFNFLQFAAEMNTSIAVKHQPLLFLFTFTFSFNHPAGDYFVMMVS